MQFRVCISVLNRPVRIARLPLVSCRFQAKSRSSKFLAAVSTSTRFASHNSWVEDGLRRFRMKTVSPYGSWKSPISSQLVTKSGVGLMDVRVDCNPELTDTVYWTELRYEEQGRYVICSYTLSSETFQQWTPPEFSARTTVHEYGGTSFCVHSGALYFSNFSDQGLYVQRSPESAPERISDSKKKCRFADHIVCHKTGVLYCIMEDHDVMDSGAKEPHNSVVAIDLNTKELSVLAEGCDFYSHPRVSPSGEKICWFQWNHPNMPWDTTEVWVADLDPAGQKVKVGSALKVAGGGEESAIEPGWTAHNTLLYVSDKSDWWNLYHVTPSGRHDNLCPVATEIAGPQWQFGKTAYVAEYQKPNKVITLQDYKLGLIDTENPEHSVTFDTGFFYNRCVALTSKGDAFFIGSGPDAFPCVVRFDINERQSHVIKESMTMKVDPGYLSVAPEFIQWPTSEGMTSHGIFFPPANSQYEAPPGDKPPLLVRAHGGPTGHYFADLDLKLQYFTSRGFAVLLVNYRGSTGHGRKYRHLLRNMWGVYDMEDCCSAVEHLSKQGRVDGSKACIDGGSAGGYTTLTCLTFKDTFRAGASHYGIGDLEALISDTHKFESRYLDNLLLPLDDPGCKELLRQRSPIHHTQLLNCPIALFQGDQDKIVPPNQAQMMFEVLKEKGLPCMLVMFQGEQHGFRKAENIQSALDKEFCFFGRVLGFTPADDIQDLPIVNLKK